MWPQELDHGAWFASNEMKAWERQKEKSRRSSSPRLFLLNRNSWNINAIRDALLAALLQLIMKINFSAGFWGPYEPTGTELSDEPLASVSSSVTELTSESRSQEESDLTCYALSFPSCEAFRSLTDTEKLLSCILKLNTVSGK